MELNSKHNSQPSFTKRIDRPRSAAGKDSLAVQVV